MAAGTVMAAEGRGLQEPGWYPDPAGGPGKRWWDGTGWTSRVQAATVSGRRTPQLSTRRQVGRRRRWLLLGALAVVLVGLIVILIDTRRGSDRPDEPTLTWSEDTGTGIAFAVGLDGRGTPIWRCTRETGRVTCLGHGRADVAAGSTARPNVIGQLHPADLVIRHDGNWHCFRPDEQTFVCQSNP